MKIGGWNGAVWAVYGPEGGFVGPHYGGYLGQNPFGDEVPKQSDRIPIAALHEKNPFRFGSSGMPNFDFRFRAWFDFVFDKHFGENIRFGG